jgi:hypothetical protein
MRPAQCQYLLHPSITGRRDWFIKHPYSSFFPRSEDLELWLRTCSVSTFAQIEELLFFYRRTISPRVSANMSGAWSRSRLIWSNREPGRMCEALLWCLRSLLFVAVYPFATSLGIVRLVRKVRSKRVANDACVAEGQRVLARILSGVR